MLGVAFFRHCRSFAIVIFISAVSILVCDLCYVMLISSTCSSAQVLSNEMLH